MRSKVRCEYLTNDWLPPAPGLWSPRICSSDKLTSAKETSLLSLAHKGNHRYVFNLQEIEQIERNKCCIPWRAWQRGPKREPACVITLIRRTQSIARKASCRHQRPPWLSRQRYQQSSSWKTPNGHHYRSQPQGPRLPWTRQASCNFFAEKREETYYRKVVVGKRKRRSGNEWIYYCM